MKHKLLKILILLLTGICILGFLFYTNSTEYKVKRFQNKYQNKIMQLKPIYNEATQYCSSQDFANRGSYTAYIEESIKKSSIQNYNFYLDIQNFCDKVTDNLADKWICVDEIMN